MRPPATRARPWAHWAKPRLAHLTRKRLATCALASAVLALSACAKHPPTPDWQIQLQGHIERASTAELLGRSAVAASEWRGARAQVSSTGQPALAARVELLACAVQAASLALSTCPGFEALRADAQAPELAYAQYLQGQRPDLIEALPAQHRAVAQALAPSAAVSGPGAPGLSAPGPGAPGLSASGAGSRTPAPGATQAFAADRLPTEPLARLVAAAALLQARQLDASGIAAAVDAASAQGWRKPLLAWLGVQQQVAAQAGQSALAQEAQRRIQLLTQP